MSAVIHSVPTTSKAIAFTFDDGPNPVYTLEVMDIFRAVGGKATFFMTGDRIEQYPDVVRAAHEQGHEIGNHTYSHPNLTEADGEEAREQIAKTERLIEAAIGRRPAVFRAPYLASDERTDAITADMGYRSIGALNLDTRDWEMPGTAHIVAQTRDHLVPGAILLFHDGRGDRSQTMEAVRALTAELDEAGYELVTVSELLARAER